MLENPEVLENGACDMQARGAPSEEILAYLRSNGASILESMRILKNVLGLSLAEAKQIVHFSETWSDMRDEHDRIHDVLEDVVKAISDRE
jgi:hypothetical protein